MAGRIKMPLDMEVGLGPGDFVRFGTQLLLSKKGGGEPQLSARGQTAGWIKVPFDMDVGLSPGDFVLDGDPAPPQKGGGAAQFSAHVYCGETAVCIHCLR